MTFETEGWVLDPEAGGSIICVIDGGDIVVSSTELLVAFDGLAPGWHQVCCGLAENGEFLPYCTAMECQILRAKASCNGPGDPVCHDGHPCSIDACQSIGGEQYECNYGPASGDCCVSKYDCDCSDGVWEPCDADTFTCGG